MGASSNSAGKGAYNARGGGEGEDGRGRRGREGWAPPIFFTSLRACTWIIVFV